MDKSPTTSPLVMYVMFLIPMFLYVPYAPVIADCNVSEVSLNILVSCNHDCMASRSIALRSSFKNEKKSQRTSI